MKYEICECRKFAFLIDAESVASLPDGYVGELCPECKLWMCAIDKLPNKVLHPTPESGGALPAVESESENVLPAEGG